MKKYLVFGHINLTRADTYGKVVATTRERQDMYITEDGIVEYEADGDCTLCDNWGCEVCG